MEKGGGYFERVRSLQTTLTRIFIVLESVSHGLSEIWYGISRKARKFKRFFRPKSGGLQKKKKVFTEFETDFSAAIGNSNVFSAQNLVVSKKKKRSSPKLRLIFPPKLEIQTFEGGLFSYGGAIFNFSQEIGLKSTKKVRFCILHKPMGGSSPPAPHLATLLPSLILLYTGHLTNACDMGGQNAPPYLTPKPNVLETPNFFGKIGFEWLTSSLWRHGYIIEKWSHKRFNFVHKFVFDTESKNA